MYAGSYLSCSLSEIFRELEHDGVFSIQNFLTDDELLEARDLGRVYCQEKVGQYVCVATHGRELIDSILSPAQSSWLDETLRGLFSLKMKRPSIADDVYSVFRLLTGDSGRRESENYHYDGYLVTVLIALEMPVEAPLGDLIISPNRRPVRRLYLTNVLENLWVKCFAWRFRNAPEMASFRRLTLEPGSLNFFWGHLSLHANEACRPEALRSTVLFHYGRPHESSAIYKLTHRSV